MGRLCIQNKCSIWTTSVAYKTLLSVVPFLAVLFYFVDSKSLAGSTIFQKYVIDNLAIGVGDQIQKYILTLSTNLNLKAIGVAGFIILIFTVISLLSTIEAAFNNIWGVPKTRSFFMRVTTYWSVVTIGPLLILLSISSTIFIFKQDLLKDYIIFKWLGESLSYALPFLVSSLAMFLIYLCMPNTKVKVRSAVLGGVIAGCLWESGKIGFGYCAANVFTYDKLYGSFAALPIFLLWIYISWLIVMLGAEIAFADQYMKSYGKEKDVASVHFEFKEYLALHVMRYLSMRFDEAKPEVSVKEMSDAMDMPVRLVNEIAFYLAEASLISEISLEEETYQVALPLEKITIQDVLNALRKKGVALPMAQAQESMYLKDFLQRVKREMEKLTTGTTYKDIVDLSTTKKS